MAVRVPWGKLAALGPKIIDNGTLLLLGGVAFVGSARHVLHLARTNGQGGLSAWLIAGSVEVLAASCGWELRKRQGWGRAIPGLVLVGSAAYIIAANLATAQRSPWGRVLAVTPAAVFLAVVLIAETRALSRPRTRPAVKRVPTQETPAGTATGTGGDKTRDARGDRPGDKTGDNRGDMEGTVADRILARLEGQPGTSAELAAAVGASPDTVKKTLGRLKKEGRVEPHPTLKNTYRLPVVLTVANG